MTVEHESAASQQQPSERLARLSFVTLGVSDLERATQFYATALGLPLRKRRPDVTFFELGGTQLALYPREYLAADSGVPTSDGDVSRVALSLNVGGHAAVDELLAAAAAGGGHITRAAAPTSWGGYAGYFQDPDGFVWEVVYRDPAY